MSLLMKYICVAVLIQCASAKLADYVSPCSARDPQLNDCVMKKANALMPFLVKGVKEFGILSLDPLSVPLMRMEDGLAGVKGLSFNITDSKHFGWKDMKFTSAKVDPKNYRFELKLSLPVYTVLGDYEVTGSILNTPVEGTGDFNITFVNLDKVLYIDGQPEVRNGQTYLKLTDVRVQFIVSKIVVRVDNLFGNKVLSDAINIFLNENHFAAFHEVEPAVEYIYSGLYTKVLAKIFRKIPYNQMFKDLELKKN